MPPITPEQLAEASNRLDKLTQQLEKDVLLKVVDSKWIDHLHNIDMLREGIGLRAYGQKDPLIEYKKEAYDLFNKMMYEIQSETVKHLFRTRFGVQIVNNNPESQEDEVYDILDENNPDIDSQEI